MLNIKSARSFTSAAVTMRLPLVAVCRLSECSRSLVKLSTVLVGEGPFAISVGSPLALVEADWVGVSGDLSNPRAPSGLLSILYKMNIIVKN